MSHQTLEVLCIPSASRSRAIMIELGNLVRRDHDDLHYALRVLAEPLSDEVHVVHMLDRICSMFPAHAEAETIALANLFGVTQPPPSLYFLASQVTAAHLAQEAVLGELVTLRPATPAFRERAQMLRHMMVQHADHEAACFHPALPDHLTRALHGTLATTYERERVRVLGHADPARLRSVG